MDAPRRETQHESTQRDDCEAEPEAQPQSLNVIEVTAPWVQHRAQCVAREEENKGHSQYDSEETIGETQGDGNQQEAENVDEVQLVDSFHRIIPYF